MYKTKYNFFVLNFNEMYSKILRISFEDTLYILSASILSNRSSAAFSLQQKATLNNPEEDQLLLIRILVRKYLVEPLLVAAVILYFLPFHLVVCLHVWMNTDNENYLQVVARTFCLENILMSTTTVLGLTEITDTLFDEFDYF